MYMKNSELYTLSKDFVRAAINVLKEAERPLRLTKRIKILDLSDNSANFEEI